MAMLTLLADGVPWTCVVCDGGFVTAPGSEPPSPNVCAGCAELTVLEALSGVAW
jgi:hypothetical protein